MLRENKALTMSEVQEYMKDKDSGADVVKFIKKFTKLKPQEAKEFREKLNALDLMKIKPEHVVKIVDLMPENQEDLNKIFTDVSLDEDESKKILDTVKEYK